MLQMRTAGCDGVFGIASAPQRCSFVVGLARQGRPIFLLTLQIQPLPEPNFGAKDLFYNQSCTQIATFWELTQLFFGRTFWVRVVGKHHQPPTSA
jgi:hypothetical protein